MLKELPEALVTSRSAPCSGTQRQPEGIVVYLEYREKLQNHRNQMDLKPIQIRDKNSQVAT